MDWQISDLPAASCLDCYSTHIYIGIAGYIVNICNSKIYSFIQTVNGRTKFHILSIMLKKSQL